MPSRNKIKREAKKWFINFWEINELKDQHDQYDDPNLVNHRFKYVIKIDDRVNLNKSRLYESNGYEILKVKAFDQESLLSAIEIVERIRQDNKWKEE